MQTLAPPTPGTDRTTMASNTEEPPATRPRSLRTAANGDQHPVVVGRVGAVGPAEGAHLAPPHPRHEEEPGGHGVEVAAIRHPAQTEPSAEQPLKPVRKPYC